jgi:hypothetical protein
MKGEILVSKKAIIILAVIAAIVILGVAGVAIHHMMT